MKYLRSYLLVPGAGGQILGSRSSAYRPLRRLTGTHRHYKVTSSSKHFLKRQVSTDGVKKSQLAAVGQVALPPPNAVKPYVVRRGKPCPRHDNCGLEGRFSAKTKESESVSYGRFLSESHSLKSCMEPLSLEMVFRPTFCAYSSDIRGLFLRDGSEGPEQCKPLDATSSSLDMTKTDNPDIKVARSLSLEALLPTQNQTVHLEDSTRQVKREIVLPRPPVIHSDTFLEVHNFQKKSDGEEKDDITPLPKYDDSINAPNGPIIIHNDRSSLIIHRDLYITNRILEKLKKIEEKPITPQPTVKAATGRLAQCEAVTLADVAEAKIDPKLHEGKSDSYLTNIEFGMPTERMTTLESLAMKSRKNLYARMRNASSPCVLVDGVHVKQAKPEDLEAQGKSADVQTAEVNAMPEEGTPVAVIAIQPAEDTAFTDQVSAENYFSEPVNSPFHMQQLLAEPDFECDKLQGDLEDWFVPLGKEIESMLLTLEASKNTLEHPEQDVFEHNIEEGSVETIENSLLTPWENQPFQSGQARDKNTSSGNLPPKPKNPNVDIKTETTIKCSRAGNHTDINITETQRYLDKRLPYPFCTETVLQVHGTTDSLSKATQAVENSKAQLVQLSNANSPNPGMLTPKLQFNHMLSKSHEKLNSTKKTVLKIKVVPNSDSSNQTEPKPQPSHILQITEQPSETSTDVSKLIRRSKFSHKTGKKIRRGDNVMKLRPKKKLNKEPLENIKVLSPKELEKMFPTPPKPKPVEKPRKVTVETKISKEPPSVIENVKQQGTQSAVMGRFKSRKVEDDILIKAKPNIQVAKPEEAPKNDGLSTRDQKILKSIISHKVKDSFMAVTKKDAENDAGKVELVKPKPDTAETDKSAAQTKLTEKSVEMAKEKPLKDKAPQKNPRSPKPASPTPKPKREYVTIKPRPTTKPTEVKPAQHKDKKPEKKKDPERPISASTIIANVMKNSEEVSQAEPRWHQLDKKATPSETVENETKAIPEPQTLPVKESETTPKIAETNEVRHFRTTDNAYADAFKAKKVWNHPSEPLLFPFETPNYKEILQNESFLQPEVYEADFCKLCTETVPELVHKPTARYRIPLERMKNFPLMNPGKPKKYSVPITGAMSVNPFHDLMLMKNLAQVPAVTKILGSTLSSKSQQSLEKWKQGLIEKLGEQGFQEFYQNQLKQGTNFHSAVKNYLVNHQEGQEDLCLRSLSHVLDSVTDVGVVESQVVHPMLGYRGVVDCVAKYKGKPVVIEWKRSDKTKPTLKHTYDAPLQLCAYLGAMNFDNNYKEQQVEGGVVVVAYSDGTPADVFELTFSDCERYWAKWLKRLHRYYSGAAEKQV